MSLQIKKIKIHLIILVVSKSVFTANFSCVQVAVAKLGKFQWFIIESIAVGKAV